VFWSVARRVFGIIVFICIISGPVHADRTHDDLIQACRAKFGDTLPAPDSSGAIHVIESGGWLSRSRQLCLYGSLSNLQAVGLGQAILRMGTIDTVVVRSTGGPVRTWLTLAEVLQGQVQTVIVDDICISSCANYAFLLGQKHIVPEGGLVVWHGGPVQVSGADEQGDIGRDPDQAEYDELAARTATYFRQRGVSLRLLIDTNELSIEPDADHYFSKPGNTYPASFDGYAIDPAALSRCYGMTGLEEMWHPVFFESVFRLGRSRSANLNLLMRPAGIVSPPCGKGPAKPATPVRESVPAEAPAVVIENDAALIPQSVPDEANGDADPVPQPQAAPSETEKHSIPASLHPTILDGAKPAAEIKFHFIDPDTETGGVEPVEADELPGANEVSEPPGVKAD